MQIHTIHSQFVCAKYYIYFWSKDYIYRKFSTRVAFADEFQTLVGEPIPYRRLGFANLRAFLRNIDGLEPARNDFGEQILTIKDSKISHLNKLICKQKDDYTKTKVCSLPSTSITSILWCILYLYGLRVNNTVYGRN